MKIQNLSIFILLIVSFNSCQQTDDFQAHTSGLKYKYLQKSQQNRKPQIGEAMILNLRIKTEKDSVVFDSRDLRRQFRLQHSEPPFKGGSIEDGFAMMNAGDSMRFLVSAYNFQLYGMRDTAKAEKMRGQNLIFDVKLLDILTKQQIEDERKQIENKQIEEEKKLLEEYILSEKIQTKPTATGLYINVLKKGTGKPVEKGKRLVVHYVGLLVNGDIFDSSIKRNEPFEFNYGANEVIDGWEQGIENQRVGTKLKLIIPSNLAYGAEGYGKLIPPFSTLLFEIEILDEK